MFRMLHRRKNEKGFTLIEMLIVVVIVAILAAISVPIYVEYVKTRSRLGREDDDQRGLAGRAGVLSGQGRLAGHGRRPGAGEVSARWPGPRSCSGPSRSWVRHRVTITGTSTEQMKGGAGKTVTYNIEDGRLDGLRHADRMRAKSKSSGAWRNSADWAAVSKAISRKDVTVAEVATARKLNIYDLLRFAVDQGASDLHLSTGSIPMIRVHGSMRKLALPRSDNETMMSIVRTVLNRDQLERFEEMKEIDFSAKLEDIARFRVNVFQQINGIGAVFRTIPSEIKSFDELGLPEAMRELAGRDRGLVLLTGPTGSGKTTTLATMIDWINEYKQLHIMTIEDPVEFFHDSKNCMINQRELGANTHSFANALRAALREDPDVILVGEMRDLETISLALTAAETGHLVLATLHTSSAAKTIDRVIDIFPAAQKTQVRSMLAESLEAVVAQKLLPQEGWHRPGGGL